MEVIPAIDLRGGKCVRLYQGDYGRETVFDADPVGVLRRWEDAGARRIHIVDLDGARDGIRVNAPVVSQLASAASVPLQLGGGIRDAAAAGELLDLGLDRVIFGTAAVEAPDEVHKTVANRGAEHVIVGVDARDGLVTTRGWRTDSGMSAIDLVGEMERLGVERVMYTDTTKDGTLSHPNFEAAAELAGRTTCRILFAGGIASIDDLVRLAELGIDGAVTGQAIYTGAIDLAEAISAVGAHSR
ncbi:MAG: 1-(5-phosphoribosyl)-5-[(5-phosphoribosylamino)methylideneamino]imidazole-4-carboxamide isomerase [Chloroflexi bacterium]|nr:1-(5-phosphoribosyl)-5-[(5-phosphoribosylamino)methylideneamino]imidazole-4-carboxamide isomerase [Chloroflexota bacterium]